jgi:exopolysaccharide production protein ExoQ
VGLRSQSFIFNRAVLTDLVGVVPVLAFLLPKGRREAAAGLALSTLVAFTILHSESGAARLGMLAMLGTAAAALLAPRWTVAAAAAAIVLVLATAPWQGVIGARLIPAKVHAELANSHSRDRIDIWTSFGAAIRAQPVLGAGFGVSPVLRETPVAERVPQAQRTLLAVGHPHNAAVQIWAELGLVGAILAAAALLLALRSVAGLPRPALAAALALMGGVAAVSIVGHGAWQGWWPAAIGAAVVWLRAALPRETPR